MEKILKKAKEGFSWEIGALTGRPGDLMKSLETPGKTGRVGIFFYVSKADSCFCLAMQYRHINFPTDRKVDNIINSLHEEPEILSFSLYFQLYISVIYQQSNDLHL